MQYAWAWGKAVGKHWKRELLGGVLIGALALFSELTGFSVAPRYYVAAAVIVLFYAMFLAWRDEYVRVRELSASRTGEGRSGLMTAIMEQETRDSQAELAAALREHAQEARMGRLARRLDRILGEQVRGDKEPKS
jgi:hypothetical protein